MLEWTYKDIMTEMLQISQLIHCLNIISLVNNWLIMGLDIFYVLKSTFIFFISTLHLTLKKKKSKSWYQEQPFFIT